MPPSNGDAGLKKAPAVMAWRRVSDVKEADKFAAKVAGFPKVGSNKYANIYDGGTALVGYWVQDRLAEVVAAEHGKANAGKLSKADLEALLSNCCDRNFDRLALVSNPANQLVVSSGDFQGAVNRLGRTFKVSPSVAKSPTGDTVSFVDQDGNFSGLFRPGGGLAPRVGTKFRTLLRQDLSTRGGAKAKAAKSRGRLVSYELLVSDVSVARSFYKDTLGLKLLSGNRSELQFDLGSIVLTIKIEPALGLVHSLQRGKRLEGDWLMFHVPDIEASVKGLKRRGVDFPGGIEDSSHGRGALFQDPDGHVLNVWEPPPTAKGEGKEPKVKGGGRGGRGVKHSKDINYFPALNRILERNA